MFDRFRTGWQGGTRLQNKNRDGSEKRGVQERRHVPVYVFSIRIGEYPGQYGCRHQRAEIERQACQTGAAKRIQNDRHGKQGDAGADHYIAEKRQVLTETKRRRVILIIRAVRAGEHRIHGSRG